MNSMTRYLIQIIFILNIVSCSNIDLGYFNYLIRAFDSTKIEISDEFYNQAKYSFIKVSYGANQAILVLSEIDPDTRISHWYGNDGSHIKTLQNGLIAETTGFGADFKLQNYNLTEISSNIVQVSTDNVFFSLREPELQLANLVYSVHDTSKSAKIDYMGQEIDSRLVVVKKSSKLISWTSKDNYYLINNEVKVTEQEIHPLRKKIRIEFYYK